MPVAIVKQLLYNQTMYEYDGNYVGVKTLTFGAIRHTTITFYGDYKTNPTVD